MGWFAEERPTCAVFDGQVATYLPGVTEIKLIITPAGLGCRSNGPLRHTGKNLARQQDVCQLVAGAIGNRPVRRSEVRPLAATEVVFIFLVEAQVRSHFE